MEARPDLNGSVAFGIALQKHALWDTDRSGAYVAGIVEAARIGRRCDLNASVRGLAERVHAPAGRRSAPRSPPAQFGAERLRAGWGSARQPSRVRPNTDLGGRAKDPVAYGLQQRHFASSESIAECVGIHAARRATRFEALGPIRQGVRRCFGGFAQGIGRGLAVRHDHGSQLPGRRRTGRLRVGSRNRAARHQFRTWRGARAHFSR